MSRLVAIACLALASCSYVFRIDEVQGGPDGGTVIPCAAPIGHDEDGDQIDDACDDCPGINDAEQLDTDGDHIGDACDPSPAESGDTLVKFISFGSAADKDDYWTTTSPWTVAGDSLVFAGGSSAFMSYAGTTPAYPFELQAKITLTTVNRAVYNQVLLSGNDGASAMHSCEFFHATASPDAWAVTNNEAAEATLPLDYSTGTTFVARATSTAAALGCQIDGQTSTGDTFTATATGAMASAQAGVISVNVNPTAVQIQWFAIYKLP